jgi:hypothetical protein
MIKAMKQLFRMPKIRRPKYIVESGTYLGEGTTYNTLFAIRRVVKYYPKNVTFYTIEADYGNYRKAKAKLRHEGWIHPIHGLSVDKRVALKFIETDEALLFHHEYPDILIDSQDPIPFYKAEIEGVLPEFGSKDQGQHEPENNVFARLLPVVAKKFPLIILDSCGGIGWLEFQTVMELLFKYRFYIFLHDINHVKHFRSYEFIKHYNNREFRILAEKENEWVLATHFGKGGNPGGRGKKKWGTKKKWKLR